MAAILNAELLTQLNEKITKRDVIRAIDDAYAGYADLAAVDATVTPLISLPTSIHVPLYKDAGGQYNTTDSCITIISLLNQWHLYTKTITPTAAPPNGEAGILSGFENGQPNAPQKDMAPHLLALLFGGIQEAIDTVTAMDAAAAAGNILGGAGGNAPQEYATLLGALRALPGAPAGGAVVQAAGHAPQPIYGGWGRILNKIAEYAGMPNLPANETYTGLLGVQPPTVNAAPVAPTTVGPTELIRYAFGLLYKIKVVLGTDWPDTHNQLSKGGRNSKNNNKRNKYTHRKKQYSQRRYKK
jgi:hypothetical protein